MPGAGFWLPLLARQTKRLRQCTARRAGKPFEVKHIVLLL